MVGWIAMVTVPLYIDGEFETVAAAGSLVGGKGKTQRDRETWAGCEREKGAKIEKEDDIEKERERNDGWHGNTAQLYTRSALVDKEGEILRNRERERENEGGSAREKVVY